MQRFGARDIEALQRCILAFTAQLDLATFPHHVLEALDALVPGMYLSYNEIDLVTQNVTPVLRPADVYFPEGSHLLAAYFHQHPVVRHQRRTGDGHALTIADFLTASQFHGLALYNEFYRRMGTEDQMSIMLFTRPSIAVNRDRRDFTERDRQCLDFLRPHLTQAYRNAVALQRMQERVAVLGQGLDALRAGVIVVEADGHVQALPEGLWQWLGAYYDTPARRTGRLPETLARWLQAQQTRRGDAWLVPAHPLRIERQDRCLVVRCIHRDDAGAVSLLLEEHRRVLSPEPLLALGLTPRQAEVLFWVAQGKTNIEAAIILSVRPRTIEKHLEHIYCTLEVDNRTAAAQRALEVLAKG